MTSLFFKTKMSENNFQEFYDSLPYGKYSLIELTDLYNQFFDTNLTKKELLYKEPDIDCLFLCWKENIVGKYFEKRD